MGSTFDADPSSVTSNAQWDPRQYTAKTIFRVLGTLYLLIVLVVLYFAKDTPSGEGGLEYGFFVLYLFSCAPLVLPISFCLLAVTIWRSVIESQQRWRHLSVAVLLVTHNTFYVYYLASVIF